MPVEGEGREGKAGRVGVCKRRGRGVIGTVSKVVTSPPELHCSSLFKY